MVTIKNIELADCKEYAVLCEELSGLPTNMVQLAEVIKKITANPDYLLVGAIDEDKQLLGSVMGIFCLDTVGECQPFMVLENMVVSKQCRRQGIGKKLIGYIEECAREKNCKFVMFTSLAKRKEAHRFYESLGYSLNVTQGFKKYL